MSIAVMISIRPEWVLKIANRDKTIEVRKNTPNIRTPFKCYIYCTKNRPLIGWERGWAGSRELRDFGRGIRMPVMPPLHHADIFNGKVVGEFVCDYINYISPSSCVVKEDIEKDLEGTCLSAERFKEYVGWKHGMPIAECRDMYGWHICDLKIYDEPKELSDFSRVDYKHLPIQRWTVECPPQSWMYVEVPDD